MKIKKKGKEPSGFEKRNTSITVFALTAFVPLILCLLLGFSLGNSKEVNWDNYYKRIGELESENEQLTNTINELSAYYSEANTLFDKFKSKDLEMLDSDLRQVENDLDLESWKTKQTRLINQFKRSLSDIEKSEGFKSNEQIKNILDSGVNWMEDFLSAKEGEFNASQLYRKKQLGLETNSDLEDMIDELKAQLNVKDLELRAKEAEIGIGQAQQSSPEKEVIISQADKKEVEAKYNKLLKGNAATKTAISNEIKEIQEQIMPNLRAGFLNKKENRNKFDRLKNLLDTKVENIKIRTLSIKVED